MRTTEPRRRESTRRPQRHSRGKRLASAGRRAGFGWKAKLTAAAAILVCVVLGWAVLARATAPEGNSGRERFDAIVGLGTAADTDGNPTQRMLARVNEAVREYERGVAPRIIFTGGAVANRFTEAEVMARTAEAQGIPPSAVFVEPQARNTIENACFSARLMKANGWRSAEVVTSEAHLPRAGLIWSRVPGMEWRMHAAPGPAGTGAGLAFEILKTARYLVWARQMERCEP